MARPSYHLAKSLLLFLVPGLLTLGAISTLDTRDDLSWLRYWVIISLFLLVELVLDKLPLPSLTLPKTAFILWCLCPDPYSGSKIVFDLIKPGFDICQYKLQEGMMEVTASAPWNLMQHTWLQALDYLSKTGDLLPVIIEMWEIGLIKAKEIVPAITDLWTK